MYSDLPRDRSGVRSMLHDGVQVPVFGCGCMCLNALPKKSACLLRIKAALQLTSVPPSRHLPYTIRMKNLRKREKPCAPRTNHASMVTIFQIAKHANRRCPTEDVCEASEFCL